MFSLFNGRNAGFYIGDISKNSDHGDMLRTESSQVKNPDIGGFFRYIGRSDHVDQSSLNQADSRKWHLGFSKDFFAHGSHPLLQEFKNTRSRVGYQLDAKCHN